LRYACGALSHVFEAFELPTTSCHAAPAAGINNIFVFAPDGTIIDYKLNFPASFHDSDMSDGFLEKLMPTRGSGLGAAGDLGFRGKRFEPFIITKHSLTCPWPADPEQRARAVFADKCTTYLRQAAEWGMNSFKNLSPRTRYVTITV